MLKVLIADDEQMEREDLLEILQRKFAHRVEVRQAENGRAAVDAAALWGADLVLMDIEMPGMNGLDAARCILQQRPQCRIIFVTAYSLFSYAQEAVRLGARDYLVKPLDEDMVAAAVQRVLEQEDTRQQLASMASTTQPPSHAPVGKAERMMDQVQDYLEKNYMYDVSQESVSQILNFSPSYFSKLFKAHFGVTFVEYLTDLRIRAAQRLLADPLRSAAEVAGMVGYEDANYFAKTFKKKTGMTPTQYRRQHY